MDTYQVARTKLENEGRSVQYRDVFTDDTAQQVNNYGLTDSSTLILEYNYRVMPHDMEKLYQIFRDHNWPVVDTIEYDPNDDDRKTLYVRLNPTSCEMHMNKTEETHL